LDCIRVAKIGTEINSHRALDKFSSSMEASAQSPFREHRRS
jgi:hypothetical protein